MVEPIEDVAGTADADLPETGTSLVPVEDADSGVSEVFIGQHAESEELWNTILFWVMVVALLFMLLKYWGSIQATLRRLFSSESSAEDEIRA